MKRPIEPTPRYATGRAMDKIAKLLGIVRDRSMQDWTYIIADLDYIDQYWTVYNSLEQEDERFTMMEILIEATNQIADEEFEEYWAKLRTCLIQEIELHQFTVYYWCCFDNENLEDCFYISGPMRKLWKELENKDS
ncbi:MAG: hypothetical protein GY810_16195 [Aureispira sp.]|nr:hypothetical protein [Aureispira sp.]